METMVLHLSMRFGMMTSLLCAGAILPFGLAAQVPSVGPGVCVSSAAACAAARAPAPSSRGGSYSGGGATYNNQAMMMGLMGSAMNSFISGMMQGMEVAEQQRIAAAFTRNDQGIQLYNSGDLAGAIAAFSEAAQYAPNDPNIRDNLTKAQQSMAERNRAKLDAARERVSGMLSGLTSGLDAASRSNTEAALDFEAPAGTSFFGTGGGGTAPKAGGGNNKSGTRPAPTAPRYSDAASPPTEQPPLDFVGMNEPLYQKGSQNSAPVPVSARPSTPNNDGSRGTAKTASRTPGRTGGPIESPEVLVPDPITYASTGLGAWLSDKFMDAASSSLASAAARGRERAPESSLAGPNGIGAEQSAPPLPLETAGIRNPTEFGARALANTAYMLAGVGDLLNADKLMDQAISYAPTDVRLPLARGLIRRAHDRLFNGEPNLSLGEMAGEPNASVAAMGRAQKSADLASTAAQQGKYTEAMRGYEEAYRVDAKPDYLHKATQAGIGMILSGNAR